MNARPMIVTVLTLAVLAAGLVGCRSSKKQAPQQTQVAQRTAPMYPAQPQQPPTSYAQPTYPAPPPMGSAPTTQMPTTPMPGMNEPPPFAGSPDGLGTGFPQPSGLPQAQPMPSGATQEALDAIAADRDARMRLDQKINDLEVKLRRAEMAANAPPVTTPVERKPAGGSQQASHFAASIKGKTSGEVEVAGSRVIIRLADAFQPGSEKLKTSASLKATLLATAQELTKNPGARIEVVGHSDGTPLKVTKSKWRDNVHLSRERAQTVASTLSKHGVSAGRIAVDGRGSVEPLVFPEKSSKDRARNRRVEVVVLF